MRMATVFRTTASLASAAVLCVLTPFTARLAARFRRLDERIMTIRDERTTLMSQVLHGIRVVKYHAWEPSVHAEVQAVRAAGVRVTVLTPGPADLAAMGGNLMNPRRRAPVLETSLRTSAAALATTPM